MSSGWSGLPLPVVRLTAQVVVLPTRRSHNSPHGQPRVTCDTPTWRGDHDNCSITPGSNERLSARSCLSQFCTCVEQTLVPVPVPVTVHGGVEWSSELPGNLSDLRCGRSDGHHVYPLSPFQTEGVTGALLRLPQQGLHTPETRKIRWVARMQGAGQLQGSVLLNWLAGPELHFPTNTCAARTLLH